MFEEILNSNNDPLLAAFLAYLQVYAMREGKRKKSNSVSDWRAALDDITGEHRVRMIPSPS